MIVEWIGCSGVGKTTLCTAVKERLRADGFKVLTPLESFIGDSVVNGADYTLWADNYLRGCVTAVPEPAIPLLLAAGGLLAIRRRRRGRS